MRRSDWCRIVNRSRLRLGLPAGVALASFPWLILVGYFSGIGRVFYFADLALAAALGLFLPASFFIETDFGPVPTAFSRSIASVVLFFIGIFLRFISEVILGFLVASRP